MQMSSNKYLILLYFAILLSFTGSLKTEVNICSRFNGRRLYVDLEKSGTIFGNIVDKHHSNKTFSGYQQCRIELISCPGCIISARFTFWNLFENCNKNTTVESCNCDHVWIYEPPLKFISGRQFCGNDFASLEHYMSKTRTIVINFFYTQFYDHAFTLEYKAIRNTKVIKESSDENIDDNVTNIITTPYFPHFYLQDTNMQFEFVCKNVSNCKVSLVFMDFLIAKESVIEVIDSNGRRLDVVNGLTFRPAITVSSGPSLRLRFYANGGTNLGFKAKYKFLKDEAAQDISQIKTSCGGLVNNLGGGITMMNMVENSNVQFYDCVWIIQPSRNYVHFYTDLQLMVVAFQNFGPDTELYVHEGSTSNGPVIERLEGLDQIGRNQHITTVSKGFYIRFKGSFQMDSRLAIAYTAFNYLGCFPGTEFSCDNKKCIPIYLQCDGFDHCGDNSDEPSTCFRELKDRRWFHTLNFFFPKDHQYLKLHEVALVFVICCFVLGLFFLILALLILVFRVNKRVGHIRESPDHIQVISNILEDGLSLQEEIIEDDEPPAYEAPPNYNDLEKLKCKENALVSQRRGNCPSYTQSQKSNRLKIKIEKCNRYSVFNEPSTSAIIFAASPFDYVNFVTSPNQDQSPGNDTSTPRPIKENPPDLEENKSEENAESKLFINQDFETLKLKLLKKFQQHKAKFVKQPGELNLNHWASDSNISEEQAKEDYLFQNSVRKIHRSFSFEM